MPRPKKSPPPKQETIPPGVSHHTVGKGFTRRSVDTTGIPNTGLRWVTKDDYPLGSITASIEWAKKFLKEAGLPAHIPSGPTALPWGTGSSVQARHYRERQDPEWYAYEILEAVSELSKVIIRGGAVILNHIEGIDVVWPILEMAYRLGNLATEAHGHGYFRKTGGTHGPRRRKLPVDALIRYLLRENREATARELWEAIPKDEEIRIADLKYYRTGEILRAYVKVNGGWKDVEQSMKFDAFRKNVPKVRKSRTR